MRFGYPVFLDLHGVPVLVVGAGRVGVRKIAGLAEAGASVHVVAPHVDDALDRSRVTAVRESSYAGSDLDGMRLVVTATGIVDVDAAVATDAIARGIWVNAADQTPDCTFILPAIARAGAVTVAVSSDGTAPAVSSWLRDRVAAEILDESVHHVAAEIAEHRRQVHAAGESTEDIDWRGEIERLRRTAAPGLGSS